MTLLISPIYGLMTKLFATLWRVDETQGHADLIASLHTEKYIRSATYVQFLIDTIETKDLYL